MPFDLLSLLDPQAQASPEDEARARVAALRGVAPAPQPGPVPQQQPGQPQGNPLQAQSALGQILAMGDDWGKGVGSSLIEGSRHQQQLDTQAQRYQALSDFHKEQERQREEALGIKRDAQGKLVPIKRIDGSVDAFNPMTGDTEQIGSPLRRAASAGGGKGGGAGGNPKMEPQWMKLIAAINPSGGRSGEMGKNQTRVNSAIRLEQLFQDPSGNGVRNLDSREMAELATGLQNLLSPGGHSAGEVQHLIPPATLSSGPTAIMEWLKSAPQGKNQQAFVEKMSHTVAREKAAALQALHASQYGVLPGFSPLYKADKARFEGILRGQGLDPSALDESLVYKAPSQAGAGGATATSALPPGRPVTRTVGGVTKMWDGKAWVPVPNV